MTHTHKTNKAQKLIASTLGLSIVLTSTVAWSQMRGRDISASTPKVAGATTTAESAAPLPPVSATAPAAQAPTVTTSTSTSTRERAPLGARVATPVVVSPASNPLQAAAQPTEAITLSTGFQKIVPLPNVPARVAIGDPEIATVTVLKPTAKKEGAGVLITGLKTGSTSLLIWDKGSATPRSIVLSVTGKAAQNISKIDNLKLDTDGQVQRLSGSTTNIGNYQQARESLFKNGGDKGSTAELIDSAVLETSGTVQVDVKVVEFTRSELQRLGVSFGRTIGSGQPFSYSVTGPPATTVSRFPAGPNISSNSSVANAFNLAFSGISDDLTLAFDILQSNGYARVLAEPSLIAQSGQEASFLAGGEVPVPVPSGNGTIGIEYKKFGVGLTFKPTILSNRTIALNVSPEVSDLDFSRGTSIQGILVPAITTRRASTVVELGEGQSFVIGGLIQRNVIANANKVPWLAELPILGAFFKNNSFSREDKELVIMVTPRFVKPRAANAPALPLPGSNVGSRPRGVWSQLFLPSGNEPVPGFTQ